jgi:lipopolysaccharide heptosyltransferase II
MSAATASLFTHNPAIHETIVFDKKGEHCSPSALVTLWQRLRAARYDLVINFQRSNLKAWLLATAALPCRVLVYKKARGRVVHAVVNHMETVAPLGIQPQLLTLDFMPGSEAEAYADMVIKENALAADKLIALNPGTSNPIKCWSTEQFAQLADRLISDLGMHVVIVGAPGETHLADAIESAMHEKPLKLAGKTSLLQLGAVLKRCQLLVSGDTGTLHMATAVGCRVVGLFGAVDPKRTGPVGMGHRVIQAKGVACVPCRDRKCTNSRYLECMEKITVHEVFDAVGEMLREKGGANPRGNG